MNVRSADPLSPSATLGESMASVGAPSSSLIVPVPVPVEIAAFTALLSSTTTFSSGSSVASPVTDTARVRLVSPAAKVRVPAASAV